MGSLRASTGSKRDKQFWAHAHQEAFEATPPMMLVRSRLRLGEKFRGNRERGLVYDSMGLERQEHHVRVEYVQFQMTGPAKAVANATLRHASEWVDDPDTITFFFGNFLECKHVLICPCHCVVPLAVPGCIQQVSLLPRIRRRRIQFCKSGRW